MIDRIELYLSFDDLYVDLIDLWWNLIGFDFLYERKKSDGLEKGTTINLITSSLK
jgi:hypothetical protein